MFYSIVGRRLCAGVVTRDGVVVQASENLGWACGEEIADLLAWAVGRDMTWSSSAIVPPGLALVACREAGSPRPAA